MVRKGGLKFKVSLYGRVLGPAINFVSISHSVWKSEDAFRAWIQSEAFRKAHANTKSPEGIYLGPPKFEGCELVL